jgi:hypothetical protein
MTVNDGDRSVEIGALLMKTGRSLLVTLIAAAILLASRVSIARSQSPDENCAYFAETDQYVCGEFLEFFESWGGLEIFGYPLTEAFDDPARGLRVQYFQRVRMEFHPYNPKPYQVQLGLLADELGYLFAPLNSPPGPAFNNSLRHYFPETGHIISHSFLRYFREHGGLVIFGYPRSEFMDEDGLVVQYFQRARMEWHPDEFSGTQIHLTNLGELYLEHIGLSGTRYDRDWQSRITDNVPPVGPAQVTELEIDASVRHVITGQQGEQTVFVYVTDQLGQPVSGVTVSMTVKYSSDEVPYTCEAPTDRRGFAKRDLPIEDASPGQNVVIDVTATYGDLTRTTQTFYLPWW